MRLPIALMALAGTMMLLAFPVTAQVPDPRFDVATTGYRGLTPEDMKSYCFWNGQLFSLGASFCIRPSAVTVCSANPGGRPIWVNKENEKACERAPTAPPQ
jgi:hypothetical protein